MSLYCLFKKIFHTILEITFEPFTCKITHTDTNISSRISSASKHVNNFIYVLFAWT